VAEKKTTDTAGNAKEATKSYSFRVKREAFNLYLDDVPPREIAARLDIVETTLKSWIVAKNWKDKREAIQAESMKSTEDQFKDLIKNSQFLTLKRKLRTAALLDKSIHNAIINEDGTMKVLSPEKLRDLAMAFKSSSDVDAKLLGLMSNQNQTLVLAGRGAMVNIGVQGMPVGSLSPPTQHPELAIAQADFEVSKPAYDTPLVPDDGRDPF
jgi:hypothetical protein